MQDSSRYHLVELHRPENGWSELQALAVRARLAAEQMSSAETPIRFLRAIFVAEDEACFLLYEGPTRAAVRAAAVEADLRPAQIRRFVAHA